MRYAMIEDGVVINTIEAEPEFAEEFDCLLLESGFGIGDFYQDGQFIRKPRPEVPEELDDNSEPTLEERTAALEEAMLAIMTGGQADV